MLPANAGAPRASLQSAAARLHTKVEALLARTAVIERSSPPDVAPRTVQFWRQPGLFVPLLLIASIIVPFNFLVAHARSLSLSQTNLLVQLVLFVCLALVTYQVFRRRQLRRRDRREIQLLAREEAATNQARDTLITESVTALDSELSTVDQLTVQLDESRAAQLIRTGHLRFQRVLSKFAIAKQLRGGHAGGPSVALTLTALLAPHQAELQQNALARAITLTIEDATLYVQQPKLLGNVLASLIDNAVAYSPSNSTVAVAVKNSEITVTDHGSGISPTKLPLLFQPFSRAEGAETFTHEGMGFSLYLDKLIMTYLGGGLALDSKPGAGTTARLSLQPKQP
jgi:two-component system sensor histidine kinase EvgS